MMGSVIDATSGTAPPERTPVCPIDSAPCERGSGGTMLTIIEAAKMLRLSPGTLRVQAHKGRLRAMKRGRDWLVTGIEVERYRMESAGHHVGGRPVGAKNGSARVERRPELLQPESGTASSTVAPHTLATARERPRSPSVEDIQASLDALGKLRGKGVITDEEYAAKRKDVLDRL